MRTDVVAAVSLVAPFLAAVRRHLGGLQQAGVDQDGVIAAARVIRAISLLELEHVRGEIATGTLTPSLPPLARDLEGPELVAEFSRQFRAALFGQENDDV